MSINLYQQLQPKQPENSYQTNISDIKNMANMVQSGPNTSQMMQMLAQKNPQLSQVMSLLNNSGMSAKQLFLSKAQQMGQDPNAIIKSLR